MTKSKVAATAKVRSTKSVASVGSTGRATKASGGAKGSALRAQPSGARALGAEGPGSAPIPGSVSKENARSFEKEGESRPSRSTSKIPHVISKKKADVVPEPSVAKQAKSLSKPATKPLSKSASKTTVSTEPIISMVKQLHEAKKSVLKSRKVYNKEPAHTKGNYAPVKPGVADPGRGADLLARQPLIPRENHSFFAEDFFTLELMDEMCVLISEGHATHHVCALPQFPDRKQFFRQCKRDVRYAEMYNEALSNRGERFADELMDIADAAYGGTAEEVAARKLQVNTRQWIVSRLLPKKYGDRVTVSGDAENPLVTQLVLGGNDIAKKIRGGDKS